MPVAVIKHQNKSIVYTDFKPCKDKHEMILTIREAADIFSQQPGKVLSLIDLRGAYGSKEFIDEGKKLSIAVFRGKTAKAAAIGITGVKKVLLQSYNAFSINKIKPFDTMDEALEYLTE